MPDTDWIVEAYGRDRIKHAVKYSQELLCQDIFSKFNAQIKRDTEDTRDILNSALEVIELALIEAFNRGNKKATLDYAEQAFKIYSVLDLPINQNERIKQIMKTACFGILGEKNADIRRWLKENGNIPTELQGYSNWAEEVFFETSIAFLLTIRKDGWRDLEKSSAIISHLRESQITFERGYLDDNIENSTSAGLELVALYHLAKAIDLLAIFFRIGENPTRTLQDINFHLDRSLGATEKAKIAEMGLLIFWIKNAVQSMMKNSIWWILVTVNSNITRFVKQLTAEQKQRPIFELWPPQSRALLEEGLLDPVKRAVVIQMPTSSGKTLLAEFRILQTKQNNPDSWIAYIVPTRALVNQITNRLREDLAPLDLVIEQAVPAFELDPIEEELLTSAESFDVLVTTQEKLDLLIRGEKLKNDTHPLGLVIVDEAHNIRSNERGLKTEMLLTIINREFQNVHFLLLSPFVPNIEDLANWLDSERSAKISIRWRPNEQLVGVVFPEGRGKNWNLKLRTLFTSQPTIEIENDVIFSPYNPMEKTKSTLGKGEISSLLATLFSQRKGGVIVIAIHKDDAVTIAQHIYDFLPDNNQIPEEVKLVRKYIATEFGEEYQLYSLLEKGVAFHHAGVSLELRYLLEWLMAQGFLNVMVATTTLAQGVNFPISSIVINDYKVGTPPQKMSLDEFWNIAGRAGRADQDTLGIIAFSSKTEENSEIENYVRDQVSELVSHLETLVLKAAESGRELNLKELIRNDPEWSNFVQYLCHAYRQIGNHSRFVAETETIIKATYGYQRIRKTDPALAQAMVDATVTYAEEIRHIDPQTLSLVDETGFSPESIRNLREGVRDIHISLNDLSASGIFNTKNKILSRLMGKLLNVDELDIRTESGKIQGDHLAYIISSWVKGAKIADIAQHELFESQDRTKSINQCIIALNNIITYSSWGLGAIESLAVKKEEIERLSKREQFEIRSVPAMIYFGVDTLEGVVMRNMGVPRSVAKQMGESFKQSTGDDLPTITKARTWIKSQDATIWNQCAPRDSILSGDDYRKIWEISNGEYRGG